MKPTPEAFEKNLYIARNTEGDPNKKELDLIRTVEERLRDHPAFVGVAPGGSTVRGYRRRSSDIDVWILFDSSKVPANDYDYFNKNTLNILQEFGAQGVHFQFVDVYNGVIDSGLEAYTHFKDRTNFGVYVPRVVAFFTGIVKGEKVSDYREQVRENIRKLTGEQREELKKQTLDFLAMFDRVSLSKLTTRIPAAEERADAVLEARRKLWGERWDKIWAVGE